MIMEEKFIDLFKEILDIEDCDVKLTDEFREFDGWNSLTFLSVISMIDDEYDVVIEGEEFNELKTVGDIINVIKSKQQV